MRRRPQRNRRRGILRATAAVVGLVILLTLAVLITSSLTAPPATAPTAPATTGPVTPAPQRTPTAGTKVKATPTPTRKVAAVGSNEERSPASIVLHETRRALSTGPLGRQWPNEAPSPNGRLTAYFEAGHGAYGRNPLFVQGIRSGVPTRVGGGDPYVRPVWSPDGRYLAYVRVAETSSFPGARWSLIRVDVSSGRSELLHQENALALTPVGWSRGKLLYLVVTATDTSLYAMAHGRSQFVGIMMPQAVTSVLLSPNGRYIAFGAPTNCNYCTVGIYDMDNPGVRSGPTGMLNELAMTWTSDSSRLVVEMRDQLAVVQLDSLSTELIATPPHLPDLSSHAMRANASRLSVTLFDVTSGTTFHAGR